MVNFRFPLLLYLYIPIILGWLIWRFRYSRSQPLMEGISPTLQANLMNRIALNSMRWRRTAAFLGLLLLLLAASGPQIGTRLTPVERKGVDLVFALDVSESMNARDVKPSRLEKAKFEISQMIRELAGDRVGLIVFAGSSNLYLPLTSDYEAAQLFLDAIDTDMIPNQGTDLGTALRTAINAFPEESEQYKVLILVSDGEDHQGVAVSLADNAAKTGIRIHTVGLGTTTGSLIPVVKSSGDTEEYKRDSQGRLVTSILNQDILQEIANAGRGIFVRFENRLASYREVLAEINSMEKRTIETHQYSQFEDRFQAFAVLALVMLVLAQVIPTRRSSDDTWRGRMV